MKIFTEEDLKKVDSRIERIAHFKMVCEYYETKVVYQELLETLWELRWAIISHMESQEKLSE